MDKLFLKTKIKKAEKSHAEKILKKDQEIGRLTKEKEECARLMKVAQDRERLLVERLGEEKYLKSLLEKLDVTNPDQSKSDISMNKSVLGPNLAPLKNIKAVPDSDQ